MREEEQWLEQFYKIIDSGGLVEDHKGKLLLPSEIVKDMIFFAKIDVEMTESIKRYDQAKEDGTLDKHFPSL